MVDQLFNKIRTGEILKGKDVSVSSKLLGIEAKQRFIEAVQNGDIAVVRKYLRFGLNPELLDDCNRPLFSLVCRAGFVDIVSELLKYNVDINAASSDGQTALHVAVAKKHVDVIKLLLVSEASLTTKTRSGLKPIDFADYGSEIWEILKNAENGFLPEITPSKIPELEEFKKHK